MRLSSISVLRPVVFTILAVSTPLYSQPLDVCKKLTRILSAGGAVDNVKTLPASVNGIAAISAFIKNEFRKGENSSFPNILVQVPSGSYSDEFGLLLDRDLVGNKGICLTGIGRPIIKRTRFDNEEDEQSVIKISGISNVVVRGFEIVGTIAKENRRANPSGVTLVNFESGTEISNITIEDNLVHTIGQLYDFSNNNGYWRYGNDERHIDKSVKCWETKKPGNDIKSSCGQAHGIYVASNQNLISQVVIKGNILQDLRLGESEAITIGERVWNFEISNNTISDVDNIGIDVAGKQSSAYQSTYGIVKGNHIFGLKGPNELGGQNDSYPFISGIYVDGGTGVSWEKALVVSDNVVSGFGIGISVGSENNFCDDDKTKQGCVDSYCDENPEKCAPKKAAETKRKCLKKSDCAHVQVRFVEVKNNTLTKNFLYGIGIGKDAIDQNSQTWDISITGNTISGNNLDQHERGYSELHFGSMEPESLRSISVTCNSITPTERETYCVRVVGGFDRPDVTFSRNNFFKNILSNLWSWAGRSNFSKEELFDGGISFPMDSSGNLVIKGSHNAWSSQPAQCS